MKHANLNRITTILLSLLLVVSFVVYISFIDQRVEHLINSDDASELVYARLLASENSFISKNWFFSTELRVLHNQIIYSLLFKLTNDWHTVRVVSYTIIYIFVLLSYYLLCRKLKLGNLFFLGAFLLIIPFSTTYFEYMLLVPYYNPYVFISFITLFLCFCYTKKKSIFPLVVSASLSCFAGMSGMRQTTNLYLPLLISACLTLFIDQKNVIGKLKDSIGNSKEIKVLFDQIAQSRFYNIVLFSLISFGASFIGIIINSLFLSKTYHFLSFSNFTFTDLSLGKLSDVLYSIICAFGYISEKSVFSMATVYNSFCFIWIFLSIVSTVYAIKNRKTVSIYFYVIALLTAIAFIIYIALATCTELLPLERYCIPLVILTFPLVSLFLLEYNWKYLPKYLAIGLVFVLSFSNILRYRSWNDADTTSELNSISNILVEKGYKNGYATFWNANVTTELSNGLIDVWCFGNENLGIYQWLQLVSHTTTYPTGKTFMLLSSYELAEFNFDDKLPDSRQIYKSDNYLIYGYEDYQDLFSDLNIAIK